MSGHPAVALFSHGTFHRKDEMGSLDASGIELVYHSSDPVAGGSSSLVLSSVPGSSPSASSAAVASSPIKMQPPTPVRRSDNLLFLVGAPPPPPPTTPPPRKSKRLSHIQKQRSKSTPRTFQHSTTGSSSSSMGNSDTFVEARIRAARMMYQSDDLVLIDSFVSGGVMDPITESRSESGASHSVSETSRKMRQMEPSDVEEWGRPSNDGTPRERLQILSVADDEPTIPVPPPSVHDHGFLVSPQNSKIVTQHGANHETMRILPLSPLHARNVDSPMGFISASRNNSPTKMSVHTFSQTPPSKNSGMNIKSLSFENSLASSFHNDEMMQTRIVVSDRSHSPTSIQNHNKVAPQPRNRGDAIRSQKGTSVQSFHSNRSKTLDKKPPTPEKTRQRNGVTETANGNVAPSRGSPTKRRRAKTPERLRLRPKTPERKIVGLPNRYSTAAETMDSSTIPSSQQRKQGFFRKLFAKKNKWGAGSEAEAIRKVISQDKSSAMPSPPTDRSNRIVGSNDSEVRGSQSSHRSSSVLKMQPSRDTYSKQSDGLVRGLGDHISIPHRSTDRSSGSSSRGLTVSLESEPIHEVDNDRPELFYAQDDISTLTLPTIEAASHGYNGSSSMGSSMRLTHRQDPSVQSENSSDPLGQYWDNNRLAIHEEQTGPAPSPTIDPFREPFFAEPDGASPTVQNHGALISKQKVLQVNVFSTIHDPAGDSPLQSSRRPPVVTNGHRIQDPSPRGYQTPVFLEHPTQDPIGGSPLHKNGRGPSALVDGSPFAPDPPLYLQSFGNSDLVSEGSSLTSRTHDGPNDDTLTVDVIIPKKRVPLSPGLQRRLGRVPIPRSPALKTTSLNNYAAMGIESKDMEEKVLDPTPRATNILSEVPELHEDICVGLKVSIAPSKKQREPTPRNEMDNFRCGSTSSTHSEASGVSLEYAPMENKSNSSLSTKKYRQGDLTADPPSSASSKTLRSPWSPSATTTDANRLTIPTAARVNARAMAFLHSLNSESEKLTSPETEVVSAIGLSQANGALLSDSTLLWSSANDNTQKSRLFALYSKGKFKNRQQQHEQRNSQYSVFEAPPKNGAEAVEFRIGAVSSNHDYKSFSSIAEKSAQKDARPISQDDKPSGKNESSYIVDVKDCFAEDGRLNTLVGNTHSVASFRRNTRDRNSQVSFRPSVPQKDNLVGKPFAISKGFEMLREQREHDIATNRAIRVDPSTKPTTVSTTSTIPVATSFESKDPIQRAGRRLLAKAAVPIQASVRRYLAQQEAVDRLWGLLEIQSYVRRWRAEAHLLASIISVVTLQAIVRGFTARQTVSNKHKSATLIQKVVRGYLVAAKTYDYVYRIIIAQAHIRGWVARTRIHRHLAKVRAKVCMESACKLQAWWRSRNSHMLYQCLLYDTIVAQCTVRRFFAIRFVTAIRTNRAQNSATKIQAVWRGFQRYSDYIFVLVDCMLIQRAVRAYLAKKETQHRRTLRASTKIQSVWRCHSLHSQYRVKRAATIIQTKWRCFRAYSAFRRERAAINIQTEWRRYIASTNYIFILADVIRIQQAARLWSVRKEEHARKVESSAVLVQSKWRAYYTLSKFIDYQSSVRIQKSFRRHIALRHFSASLRSIIITQSVARMYIGRKERLTIAANVHATTIQSHWRRCKAQKAAMNKLACILQMQSVVRLYLAKVNALRLRLAVTSSHQTRAATKIQSTWRAFWEFSHYLILQYEVIRMQAFVRGKLYRQDFNLQLGCCIMIQSTVRRFITTKKLQRGNVFDEMVRSTAWEARERLACTRIQFWWRIVLECRKEKRAALVIERFFLMIKRDIELEIERCKRAKQEKQNLRRIESRDKEDKLLEKVWINSVESNNDLFSFASESGSDIFDFSPKVSYAPPKRTETGHSPANATKMLSPVVNSKRPPPTPTSDSSTKRLTQIVVPRDSGPSPSRKNCRSIITVTSSSPSKRSNGRSFGHHASSPSKNLIMRHEHDLSPMNSPQKTSSKTISNESPLQRVNCLSRTNSLQPDELSENLSLEEAYLDAEIKQTKLRKRSRDHSLGNAGATTPYLSLSRVNHFFADDLESLDEMEDACTILGGGANAMFSAFDNSEMRSNELLSARSTNSEHGRPTPRSTPKGSASRENNVSSSRNSNSLPSKSIHSSSPSKNRSINSSSPSKNRHSSSSKNMHTSPTKTIPTSSPSKHSQALPSKTRVHQSPSRKTGDANGPSPRHGKIMVMKSYADYPKKISRENIGREEEDDEFGMI